jgi:hypothetical protein
MSACEHEWIETAEAETGEAYELCLRCGDDRPAAAPYTEQETTK